MNFLYLGQKYTNPRTIRGLIAASTAGALFLNWYGLTLGITNVFPHILYIPIILTAYYYPRRGIVFTASLSVNLRVACLGSLLSGSGYSPLRSRTDDGIHHNRCGGIIPERPYAA